jgi:hypothetical protein
MLHRGGASERSFQDRHPPHSGASGSARVLLAVAPPPRLGNPTRWGWPHWLAPAYEAGGHSQTSSHRTLEDYG